MAIVSVAAGLGLLVGTVRADEPELTRAEFDRLQKVLSLKNQPWAAIPWKNTLPEARAQAVREKKPIFMVVNTGNCLGFV
jgi:riboflavin biosynthesis pyrimidine reductase